MTFDPISTLSAAATSLVGAWAGARTALSRFRSERGFERRIEWFERGCRTMERLRQALLALSAAMGSPRELYTPRERAVVDIGIELDALLAERVIYGTPEVVQMASKVINEINAFAAHAKRDGPTGERCLELANHLLQASVALGNALRSEFG